MNRRTFVTSMAGTAAASALAGAAENMPGKPITTLGFSPDCFVQRRPSRAPLDFLNLTADTGGGGAQVYLRAPIDPELPRQIRELCEKRGLFVEVTTGMPQTDDTSEFEAIVKAAKECGANCMRSVCLGGRRYENFDSMEQWKEFVADARARLARTAPIMERMKMTMGIENHKDWTADEMYKLMKEFGGEYFGLCFDFGNNMSLLDLPLDFIEQMAQFTKSSHVKDMGVEEYDDGYLIAEVPLGEGILPVKQILDIMLKVRPQMNVSMDFLTRDPLKIPCLTDKYWVTFPDRPGTFMAKMLRTVRENTPPLPLPRLSEMSKEEAIHLETENLYKSIVYARDVLGLTRS